MVRTKSHPCPYDSSDIAAPIGIMMMAIQWTIDALYAIFDWPGYQARYMKGED